MVPASEKQDDHHGDGATRNEPQPTDGLDRPQPQLQPQPQPDNQLKAWLQVVPAFIAFAMTWGYATAFAAYQLYYTQTMRLPSAQVSWIGSIQLFLYFVGGIVSGRLADSGHTRWLYLGGSIVTCFGMFMTSLCTQFWQILLAQAICTGLGGGFIFIPSIANLAMWFKQNGMFVMALSACGSSVGAIIFAAIAQYLPSQIGFPWAARVSAFVALAFCALGNICLQPKKATKAKRSLLDWTAFRDPRFMVFCAAAFCIWFGLFALLIYVNSFARNRIGISYAESINFVFISQALAVIARPISGAIAHNYLGPINTFSLCTIALAAIAFGWTGVSTRAGMYTYSSFMGFFNGAAQSVFPGGSSSLVDDKTKVGTWVGMVYAVCGFASLAGPPVMGAIIDSSGGSYTWAQVCFGIVLVVGSLLGLGAGHLVGKHKNKGTGRGRWFFKT